uniref:CBS domain-containing protein n=1 Tax=Syphacia muris TaxID=451379 RepID=A0A0N5ALR3_9BILA
MVDFDDSVCNSSRNIYYHDCSVDSAIASAESSRRNSNNPFGEFKEFVRRRRYTNGRVSCINNNLPLFKCSVNDGYSFGSADGPYSKFRVGSKYHSANNESVFRKVSVDSQFFDDSDDEAQLKGRRFSVPEKALCNADYAILRPSEENRYEIVTAFDKYADPYKQYMQSVLCYDLAPSHGMVVLIDSRLTVHKALIALCQATNNAALIVNPAANDILGILTATDCLKAIMVAVKEDIFIGHRTIGDFLQKYNGRRRLVTAPVNMSVWDAARLFCLNHVHRIPIIQADDSTNSTDVLYLLSLKTILCETILGLSENSGVKTKDFSLAPHIKNRTLEQARIGTWTKIITVPYTSCCGAVIDVFFNAKISCAAVVDDHGKLIGSISKIDIMRFLTAHDQNYMDLLLLPIKNVYGTPSMAYVHNTIYDAIDMIIKSDQHCVFVVDVMTEKPVAAVAYIDIMDYILNSSEIHHKMSVA